MLTLDSTPPKSLSRVSDACHRTIGDYLGESLRAHAPRTALVHGGVRWSFAQLDAASSHIARRVLEEGDSASAPVAVLLEKTPMFVACWLGILRSGRILVAIDPTDPAARVRQILEDAGAQTVLIAEAQRALLEETCVPNLIVLAVDSAPTDSPAEFRAVPHTPGDPCMLIYTSGSTGIPKGVIQTHRNLVLMVVRLIAALEYCPSDRIAHTSTVGFIISSLQLMSGLGAGAEIHLHNVTREGPECIGQAVLLRRHTCLYLTPTVMRGILDTLGPNQKLDSVRVIRLAGEPLFRREVEHFRKFVPERCVMFNGYGSTEVITASFLRIPRDLQLDSEIVPAGYAIEGVQILLLDEDGAQVGPGGVGEICVHSANIAPGYWRRPEETREAFVPAPDPAPEFGDRMYRTGDLGRFRPDGCIEVLGRRDQQVKIRGVRIETAEVERVIMEHPGVRLAVAVKCAFAPGDERLVAFWTPSGRGEVAVSELRESVTRRLPAAMRPSLILRREELPLTSTGKINRTALAESARTERPARGPVEPPQTDAEFALREIWEEVLNIRPVGVTDHFFDLGGHSLLVMRVIEEAARRTGAKLVPESFLRAPTIREMAREIGLHRVDSADERLVTIHDAGGGTPLWVMDSHRMTFFEYAPLLELFPRDRPIRMAGLNMMDGGGRLLASVEDASRELAELIRREQPEGPMVLLGHCMGGMIAMEVARLLAAEGRVIERVIIIEPSALRRWLEPVKKFVAAWGRLRGQSLEAQIGSFLDLRARAVRMEARLRNWRRWISPAALARRVLRTVGNSTAPVTARLEESESAVVIEPQGRVARDAAGASLTRLGGVALRGYHPVMRLHFARAFDGPMTVIRAESSDVSQQPYPVWRREWERFGRGNVEIHVLPGGHHTILQYPRVRALAETICARLKKTNH